MLDGKAPLNNPTFTGTVAGINKDAVGLSNVDNTSDQNKPISALTQQALNNLNTTVTNLGTSIASKVDSSILTDKYYNKTQVDNSLEQNRTR